MKSMRVPLLNEISISAGERWIYSAGFNVDSAGANLTRVEEEMSDLKRLVLQGARIAVLAHQGSFRDGSARPLDFIAPVLSEKMGLNVTYVADCIGGDAEDQSASMACGQIKVFGNTRLHAGEENNDPEFARRLARLGDFTAVGGFSKAHRVHASNQGILRYLPGWMTSGIAREMDRLRRWAGRDSARFSVAIIGGYKSEKIEFGLTAFAKNYDVVIPVGTVLNLILQARGKDVGCSNLGQDSFRLLPLLEATLEHYGRKIRLPKRVIVAAKHDGKYGEPRQISIGDYVRPNEAIVDVVFDDELKRFLELRLSDRARLLVAGTPSLVSEGFTEAASVIENLLAIAPDNSILLGGDSIADLDHLGPISSGGGSALVFLGMGEFALESALIKSQFRGAVHNATVTA